MEKLYKKTDDAGMHDAALFHSPKAEAAFSGKENTAYPDVLIVGGGPAGLAAAVRLYENGVKNIVVLEREKKAGGILRQCIHDGFGLARFSESLSGPEYAKRFIDLADKYGIRCLTGTAVTDISPADGNGTDLIKENGGALSGDNNGSLKKEMEKLKGRHHVTAVSREGLLHFYARAVILAMGCRERTRGALAIPGERPAGVFTAGVAQAYINLYNRMPAREVVILGSGDIGMIMARRLTLEGAHVHAVFEIMPYPSGLPRNIQQCLKDFDIPLYLSQTVTAIHGDTRLKGVTVSSVDEKLRPIAGTEKYYPCDTLILSAGLIPENELSLNAGVKLDPRTRGAIVDQGFMTSVPGIFAAGNVLHVHDLVDYVSLEAEKMAEAVCSYIAAEYASPASLNINCSNGVHHTVPQKTDGRSEITLSLRVTKPMKDISIKVRQADKLIGLRRMKKAIPAEMIQIKAEPDPAGGDLEVYVE